MSPLSSVFFSSSLAGTQGGLAAIAAGNQRLNRDAQQIANPDSQDVTPALLDLNQSRVLTEAGADVISTENKMLGTLLDSFAAIERT
jgi:hypothetical protein